MEDVVIKDTCIQEACFLFPFFEAGEWFRKEKTPWQKLKKDTNVTSDTIRDLAKYTNDRLTRGAEMMDLLLSIHDDWDITVKPKKGVYMETDSMKYEDIVPKLAEAGYFENDDYLLFSEYTRKWGTL